MLYMNSCFLNLKYYLVHYNKAKSIDVILIQVLFKVTLSLYKCFKTSHTSKKESNPLSAACTTKFHSEF